MTENKQDQKVRSLRIISPELYRYIISTLEESNIHSYDILLKGMKKKTGIQVILHYGENFAQNKTALFSFETIKGHGDDLTSFIQSVSEDCKKVMIDDYFNLMAP